VASYRLTDAWLLGVGAGLRSNQVYRGDEGNQLDPLSGYLVLDAHSSYRLLEPLTLFVKAKNLLNTEYETFGILGDGEAVLPFAQDPRFVGPAAPFGVWAGLDLEFYLTCPATW